MLSLQALHAEVQYNSSNLDAGSICPSDGVQEVRQKALKRMSEGFLAQVNQTTHMATAYAGSMRMLSHSLQNSVPSRPSEAGSVHCSTAEDQGRFSHSIIHAAFIFVQTLDLHHGSSLIIDSKNAMCLVSMESKSTVGLGSSALCANDQVCQGGAWDAGQQVLYHICNTILQTQEQTGFTSQIC